MKKCVAEVLVTVKAHFWDVKSLLGYLTYIVNVQWSVAQLSNVFNP